MILSVSRRTDIPNYYSEWFFNRIKEGFVYVRNPMNAHRVSKIDITPEVVDCIVFWTKNPEPMINRLDELAAYDYYFQFTLTGYGKEMECNVPHKKEKMIPIFQELSKRIGKQKVIWRYDPRVECGCMESVEIGTYNTCKNRCKYCYANDSEESVVKNCDKYDPESPILCGTLNENDKITERKVKSLKEQQISIFD